MRAIAPGFHDQLLVTELRTVAADGLWLSPAFERDVPGRSTFTWRNDTDGVLSALPGIEAALAPFDARAALGQGVHDAG